MEPQDPKKDLDVTLLRDGPVSLYWSREKFEQALIWFVEHGYTVVRFDCDEWTDLEQMHRSLAQVLEFPDYYGKNWNALNDVLGDLEEPLTTGLLLCLQRFDVFAGRFPREAHTLLDLLAQHSRRELVYGGRLLVLAQSDDPQFSIAPVGAVPVLWNREEWLNSSRGLAGSSKS